MEDDIKILCDEKIPCAKILFGQLGEVVFINGSKIPRSELKLADALIIRSETIVNADLLSDTKIKFVGTATAGTDHIDKKWLKESGISFSSAPGCNAIAVVEYVFSSLLWLAAKNGFFLRDKIVGIIGVGNIGSCLNQRLKAIGVRTILCDPILEERGIPGPWKNLETLVTQADIITLHTPLTREGLHPTWHIINDDLISTLPNNRILINTSRGPIIDNIALNKALQKGKSLSVILDVWEKEPFISLSLLNKVDIGTAHIAGYSLEGKVNGTVQIFISYSNFLKIKYLKKSDMLIPPPTITKLQLRSLVNEESLRQLVHLLYNVKYDDMHLRRVAGIKGQFNIIRKDYHKRREWSSLCVEIEDPVSANILTKLGFNTQINI